MENYWLSPEEQASYRKLIMMAMAVVILMSVLIFFAYEQGRASVEPCQQKSGTIYEFPKIEKKI